MVVRDHFGVTIPAGEWNDHGVGGAAASVDGRAWVAPADGQPVALGAALAWALRQGATDLHLLVPPSDAAGRLGAIARRASTFAVPPVVWRLDGTNPTRVAADPPDPILVPAPVTAEQALLLEQAGVDVVVEEGEVLGEVRGLEVARVVVDEPEGTPRLEVGVGRFDREAFALIHGELSPPEALARVVADIGEHRRPGVEPHPINRLARERWLRHQLVESPALVGASELHPVDAAHLRGGLRDKGIAVALGTRSDGTPVVVAASVGVDLEAVPDAADARLRHSPDADLVLVVPPRDDHPITRELAALLARPAEIVTVDGEWPT